MEVESNSHPLYKSSAKSIAGNNNNYDDDKGKKRRNICCCVSFAVILVVILIMVILGFTVFKAKRPEIAIASVGLNDLDFSLDIARLQVRLNLTLDVYLSIKNPNKVGFVYKNSSAVLKYHGNVVGEAPVPAGKISAGEKKPMNVTLTLMADRLISNSELFSDVVSGTLPLNTYTRVSGKVRVLFFNIHVVSSTTCDIDISITNRSVTKQRCKYKTKL